MAKSLMVLAGMLAVLLVTALPAPAQEESGKDGAANEVPPGPPPDTSATLAFELAVEGEPPAGTTFFGVVPAEGCISVPLADADGDGVFTGSTDVPKFPPGPVPPPGAEPVSLPVQIVQADSETGPCNPTRVIKDFGEVLIDENQAFSASVSFPDDGDPNDLVTATFELTIDGEVPEGRLLGIDTGIEDVAQPVFCSTFDGPAGSGLPSCEDGETYSDTFEVPASSRLSYQYTVYDYEYGGVVETFAADNRTFSEDTTVSATYRVVSGPGSTVTTTGLLEKPEATTYQYGTHAITDEETGTLYTLGSDEVDLDDYVNERVALYGVLVPGYEDGQVENGPPLVAVAEVRPVEETVAVEFELTVEGKPPADATFFGYLGYEPAPFQLTDPDGDGVYTGSTPPDLVPAGDTQPASIVQGTGTRESQVVGTSPGDPISTIEDFGEVTFEEDTTLSASISFEDGGSGDDGFGDDGFGGGLRSLLPSTGGGMILTVLVTGALLILGGLLLRRIFR